MLLAGRAAFITGGGGRIGRAIAATLRAEGARVALADRNDAMLAAAQHAIGASGDLVALAGDTANEATIERLVDDAEAAIGAIDLLVTCAAVYPNVALVDSDVAQWDEVYAVNVRGVMLACRAFARRWIERDVAGAIVNLSSGAARSARRGAAAYCGSKAAVNMLGEVFATELGPRGIRVNTVAPGLVMDDVLTAGDPSVHPYYNAMLEATPLGRTGAAAEIADTVAFLLSDRSRWTTGALIEVTGGSHCGRTHVPFTTDIKRR
jgi:NAD(P)-dependent dehydrogenase (short-subunit alcohol dehydrogenase family)